jgi:hypothetical protein
MSGLTRQLPHLVDSVRVTPFENIRKEAAPRATARRRGLTGTDSYGEWTFERPGTAP